MGSEPFHNVVIKRNKDAILPTGCNKVYLDGKKLNHVVSVDVNIRGRDVSVVTITLNAFIGEEDE